ncbi:transcriptional regulator, AraC family [Candidatus Vecturithrix granuli]|uniref:Transcriptional regulator, AraC family n=1 Tax=Vecturithrix granuli TaxID=1499967 RepID=A0A081C661_VECG1|nr:transcriptional regulator, AraC family [Candidatus Vecturithrix granuli]
MALSVPIAPIEQTEHDQARIWMPEAVNGIFLLKARFLHFAYKKHVHEEFGIGVIEQGAEKFEYQGEMHVAPASSVVTVNPEILHDGAAATDSGFQYRMAYVPAVFVQELLSEVFENTASLRYFSTPVTFDPDLSRRLLYALRLLEQNPDSILEAQSCFFQTTVDLFLRHTYPHHSSKNLLSNPAVIRHACEFIRARVTENISLDEIAREVGVSRFYFLRLFKASTGLSPHAYLMMRRLELAKHLIQQGKTLAQAAYNAGFADQSHLTRHFKAAYGFTPGQFQHAIHP